MGLALFLLFIVLPLIELAVIIQVGSLIGVLPTFAIMVLSALIGSWLCKREGLGVLRRINASLDAGRVPTTELADGALIVLAGCMMITPGFVTDLAGILLLLPPVRAMVRKVVVARSRRRIDRAVAGAGPAGFTFIRMGDVGGFGGQPFDPFGGGGRPRRSDGDVIDADSWEDPVAHDGFGQLPGPR